MVLGYIAKHSLLLSHAPRIITLAKELAKEPKILNSISMDRTSASYKTHSEIAKTITDKLATLLESTCFSYNMEEATSSNNERIMCILVSYFSFDV